jgi:FdhE protein
MTASDNGLNDLEHRHPEWAPWLAVIQEVVAEAADPKWDSTVPRFTEVQTGSRPLLSGATLILTAGPLQRFLERLLRIASAGGNAKMATLKAALQAPLDVLELFSASLHQNNDRLKQTALALGADEEAFQAVATLLPVPFLQACNHHWASAIPESWLEGYCPICGTWPAFAEVRGVERSRYIRCGRCGSAWHAHFLFCPYCGTTDHEELASLVPQKSGSNCAIETCSHCQGYIKSFTVLQGSPAARVLLDDLASVDLDIAAVEQGYRRPHGPGYALTVTVMQDGRMPMAT